MSGVERGISLKGNLTPACLTLQLKSLSHQADVTMFAQLLDTVIWLNELSQLVTIKPSQDQDVNCEQLTKT